MVDVGILIVVNESLYAAIEMKHVGVAHLFPATPTLTHGVGVPMAQLGSTHLPPLGSGGAVDNEIFEFSHSALGFVCTHDHCSSVLLLGHGEEVVAEVDEIALMLWVCPSLGVIHLGRARAAEDALVIKGKRALVLSRFSLRTYRLLHASRGVDGREIKLIDVKTI